jgi:hypothetical protein
MDPTIIRGVFIALIIVILVFAVGHWAAYYSGNRTTLDQGPTSRTNQNRNRWDS